jgi:hypothetical protein
MKQKLQRLDSRRRSAYLGVSPGSMLRGSTRAMSSLAFLLLLLLLPPLPFPCFWKLSGGGEQGTTKAAEVGLWEREKREERVHETNKKRKRRWAERGKDVRAPVLVVGWVEHVVDRTELPLWPDAPHRLGAAEMFVGCA